MISNCLLLDPLPYTWGIHDMRKVITYGTFDLIHPGHINILRRAREMGDYLIVGLSTDDFNEIKNKKAFHNYETRKYIVSAIRYVNQIIPEENWEQKVHDIIEYEIDLLVMGDDWRGKFDHLNK